MESWWTRVARRCFFFLTQLGIQTFTSSTLPTSIFWIKKSISIALYPKQTVCFQLSQNMISTSELESWEARIGKINFSSDISRISNSSFSKITAVNSCIRFWNDAFILLQDSVFSVFFTRLWYSEEFLVLFLTLAWVLSSRFPSTTFFSQKCVSFLKSIVAWSIYRFCAVMEIIAVRLRLLFFVSGTLTLPLKNTLIKCSILRSIHQYNQSRLN